MWNRFWRNAPSFARLPLAFHPGTGFPLQFVDRCRGLHHPGCLRQLFEEFLRERIFAPLGMLDTAFWVPPEKAGRLALIYGPAKRAY